MTHPWQLQERSLRQACTGACDAPFSLGNGYMGVRGFFEEAQEAMLGGIYLAGVFGRGAVMGWQGRHQELVNAPNCFFVCIEIAGEIVRPRPGRISQYRRCLDMECGLLRRSYVWTSSTGTRVRVQFERFVSLTHLHLAGQRIVITPLTGTPQVTLHAGIHTEVTNLIADTLKPEPTRPGLGHLKTTSHDPDTAVVRVASGHDGLSIAQGQSVRVTASGRELSGVPGWSQDVPTLRFRCRGKANRSIVLTKLVHTYTSRDGRVPPFQQVRRSMKQKRTYDELLTLHTREWATRWHAADIRIQGHEEDQRALRFNLFHLMQACPRHDPRLSIGARGLTGEMHEGGIFWDTEIFKLPFFVLSDPQAARNLLRYRHHTLPAARRHARDLWFEGAMYAWKSGSDGTEQTEMNVGAYYAIHIVADIAHAVHGYWEASGDEEFMQNYGTEILIETARFWSSRAHYDPVRRRYTILAVRGPNEYDVIVNNSLYTNMMAVENVRHAQQAIARLKKTAPVLWRTLARKLRFKASELSAWTRLVRGMTICYDRTNDLYLEDDMYRHRVPFDLRRGKPTGRRVIDSTLPYEAMALYQITKQSDVITLMNLLPQRFTPKQCRNAYRYYEPRTVHDSSLSYSPHGVMAARLGLHRAAYRYFRESAYLDLDDGQLNTTSGLHYANLGGTWQIAVLGFAGVRIINGVLELAPNLPTAWKQMRFRLHYRGALLHFTLAGKRVEMTVERKATAPATVRIDGKRVRLPVISRSARHSRSGELA